MKWSNSVRQSFREYVNRRQQGAPELIEGEILMKKITASDIAGMPVEERIQLVEDIWDSIAELPESVSVPQWHKEELERRLDAYHANPEGTPWGEVKEKLLNG